MRHDNSHISRFIALYFLGLIFQGHAVAQSPLFEQVDLFEAGKDGYVMFRIPGIVCTSKGTLLAYCEARAGSGDWTPQDVLLRRSTDGGKTWTPPKKMAVLPPDHKPNPAGVKQKLSTADSQAGKFTAHNAIAIPDARPNLVHFIYHIEYARVFYLRSEDDGVTWSAPKEITSVIEGFRDRYDWVVVGNGCGHAIQLRQGAHKGRLVVPLWLSVGTGGHAHRPSDLAVIYSDDGGDTWKRGDFIARSGDEATDGTKIVNPSETSVIELSDGRVMANIRSESAKNRRLISVSNDGATGWSKAAFCEELKEPVCMASTVRFDEKRILFANPDNLLVKGKDGAPGKNRERRNVTVKISSDDGKTWPIGRTIVPGYSGYSDLTVGKDGTIYCFVERGDVKGNHYYPSWLTVFRFNMDWLMGTQEPKRN